MESLGTGAPPGMPMPLSAGQSLSFYEILGSLGAGAMGEVYRARDTRLEREVAIKVLPEHFIEDEERLRRFEREAKVLASLNHPNVAQIYGVDQVENTCFLVLELVAGESLEDRLNRGPLPVDEAIDVCRQIAEGLEAAHEAGVIHRDLKPANVRLTPDGKVKVLDFGLAKPAGPDVADASSNDSVLSTEAGRLLGTPTYMAPEQARGKPIDRRVDVWAFGCVLYECLTGRRAFDGETIGDVFAAVLEKEAELGRLPAGTPAEVRRVIGRCLVKDPRRRLRDVGDARLELEGEAHLDVEPVRRARVPLVGAAVLVAGLAGFGLRALLETSPEPTHDAGVVRFAIEGLGIPLDAFQGLALSPDGSKLVFRARGEQGNEQLFVRFKDTGEARPLEGTDFGWLPFFAPDGDRVGFYSIGELKTVTISSGLVRSVARLTAGFSGGVWLDDDTLIVTGTNGRNVWSVPASGGEPVPLTLDLPASYDIVASPGRVPIEGSFLLAVREGSSTFELALCTLDGRVTLLAENVFSPTWSASGHLMFQQGMSGPLMAMPFDPQLRAATGEAFPVLTDLGTRVSYQARTFSIADDGTLAYLPTSTLQDEGSLVWVDHAGEATPIKDFGKVIDTPRLSHDGKRIAFRAPAPECSIWIHELERDVTTLATHESDNHGIAWAPRDERIAFARPEDGLWDVQAATPDGIGEPESLIGPVIPDAFVADYSPDGRHVLVISHGDESGADIEVVDTETRQRTMLVQTRFAENAASFSPNGRYVAYVSNESGMPEIYVQPFPRSGKRVQITTGGGNEPVWARNGKTLFFRDGRQVLAVDVETEGPFDAGRPRLLFSGDYASQGASGLADYDVSLDGARFVMVSERLGRRGATVNVVLNWFDELASAGSKE